MQEAVNKCAGTMVQLSTAENENFKAHDQVKNLINSKSLLQKTMADQI
jgi:hypothetical protein